MAGEANMIRLSRREQRKLETIEKHKKACVGCGVVFSKRDNTYCSSECKAKHIQKKNTRTCDNCGKQFARKYRQTTKYTMCSKECQAKVQSRLGVSYYESKASNSCVTSKTLRVKKRYKAKRSALRKESSEGYAWWRLCKSQASNINSSKEDSWDRRCNSAANLLRKRFEPIFRLVSKKIWDWDSKISRERITRLRVSNITTEELKWNNRIQHAAKNAQKRLALKG